jgi:hypothetical protein
MRVLWPAAVAGVCLLAAGACDHAGMAGHSAGTARLGGSGTMGGLWGTIELVRGPAANPIDAWPRIAAISCASPGNCTAGGSYSLPPHVGPAHALVVSEFHGSWGTARLVPGLVRLDQGPASSVDIVSCVSPGNCTAAGSYQPVPDRAVGPSFGEPFVVSQVRGAWRTARPLLGFASLNTGRLGWIAALSCTAPGECSAGGNYMVRAGTARKKAAFVVSEVHGRWLRARQAPGTAALSTGGEAQLAALSCASPGNCAAGGYGKAGGFVIDEVNGKWLPAQLVTGLPGFAVVSSVSCAAPGDCAAGGTYADPAGRGQAFVADEVNGRWGPAEPVAGIPPLNKGHRADVTSISCTAPGDCTAAGSYSPMGYQNGSSYDVPFVVSQVHGNWGRGRPVPGLTALDAGDNATVFGLSCASPGNCAAGGTDTGASSRPSAFLVSQVRGTWGMAQQVLGLAALGGAGPGIYGISCPAPASCTAVGGMTIIRRRPVAQAAFVVSRDGPARASPRPRQSLGSSEPQHDSRGPATPGRRTVMARSRCRADRGSSPTSGW